MRIIPQIVTRRKIEKAIMENIVGFLDLLATFGVFLEYLFISLIIYVYID